MHLPHNSNTLNFLRFFVFNINGCTCMLTVCALKLQHNHWLF